jgi:ribonucleoside-diphosphate reductase alpha chain
VVGARHQSRRLEIFLRRTKHLRARNLRAPAHPPHCRTIADWGIADGYFSKADGEVFYEELTWLCLNQYGAFNSPVWFNVGLFHQYGVGKKSGKGNWFYNRKTGEAERATTQYEYPQGSACFIQSVEDNMEDIMHLAYSEAMLFKYGSGTGTDLSPIRSSREKLSGGGRPAAR